MYSWHGTLICNVRQSFLIDMRYMFIDTATNAVILIVKFSDAKPELLMKLTSKYRVHGEAIGNETSDFPEFQRIWTMTDEGYVFRLNTICR